MSNGKANNPAFARLTLRLADVGGDVPSEIRARRMLKELLRRRGFRVLSIASDSTARTSSCDLNTLQKASS